MAMIAPRPRGALCCAVLAVLACSALAAVEFEEPTVRGSTAPAANANVELEAALRKAADLEAEALQLIANVSAIASRRFRHRRRTETINATVAMRRNASHADADDEEDDLPMLNANISLTMTRKAGAQDRKQQQQMSEGTAYLRAAMLPPDLRF